MTSLNAIRTVIGALLVFASMAIACGDAEFMTDETAVATNGAGQTLVLSATPDNLDVMDGGAITILLELYAADGSPIEGASVVMTATIGDLAETALTTDVDGIAVTTLSATGKQGYSIVVATYKNLQAKVSIDFYSGDPGGSNATGGDTTAGGTDTGTDTGTGTGTDTGTDTGTGA
ncbi:MAG: hypothetical protein KJ042_00475 [Deltaproteobacteria bacterium]|nr:hypothetical protein [Deltaproteobacteria bacterium]